MKTAVPAFLAFAFALSAESACAAPAVPLSANKEETMETRFRRVPYKELNALQKESHNFHKVAAALANYGYNAIRLSDDWEGADFIAVHIDGETMLRVQLKGRFGFAEKYRRKNLWIAFRDSKSEAGDIYVYPHDELLSHYIKRLKSTAAWRDKGVFHFPKLSVADKQRLAPYRINL